MYWYLHTLNLLGGKVDYDSGPYNVLINRGETEVNFDVSIINDKVYEVDELFGLVITTFGFPPGLLRSEPHAANVSIIEDDCELLLNFEIYIFNLRIKHMYIHRLLLLRV